MLASHQELKEVYYEKIFQEEKRALTPAQKEELQKIRSNNIEKVEDVDLWRSVDGAKFDAIIKSLQSQFRLPDLYAQNLRNTKNSGARCKVHRIHTFERGKATTIYGIFAAAQVAPNRYDLLIAYSINSYTTYRVDGKPITVGVLEDSDRLEALSYFRSESKYLL